MHPAEATGCAHHDAGGKNIRSRTAREPGGKEATPKAIVLGRPANLHHTARVRGTNNIRGRSSCLGHSHTLLLKDNTNCLHQVAVDTHHGTNSHPVPKQLANDLLLEYAGAESGAKVRSTKVCACVRVCMCVHMLVFLCVLVHAIVHAHVCVRERKRERVIKAEIMMSSAFTRGQGQKKCLVVVPDARTAGGNAPDLCDESASYCPDHGDPEVTKLFCARSSKHDPVCDIDRNARDSGN